MNFSDAHILVEPAAVTPTLKLTAMLRYEPTELPVLVDGALYAESGKLLAPLHAEPRNGPFHMHLYPEGANNSRQELHLPLSFWAPLSARHLEVIEDLREKNRKGDAILKATLTVQYQKLKVEAVDLGDKIRHVEEPKPQPKRSLKERRVVTSVASFLAIETGPKHTGPTVLSTRSHVIEQTSFSQTVSATIPGSDWINDFSPALGRGRYLVVEVPDPSGQGVRDELRDRFVKAAQAVAGARKKLYAGEWSEVCEELRPLYELLRSWSELDALIGSEYGPDAAKAFSGGLRSFFDFSSKFLHPLARDGRTVNPNEVAKKEDAQLLYSLAAGTLNLIARKWGRGL